MASIRLDLGRTWADAVAMARANADALSAIAGMFMLLPGIVSGWLLPDPKRPGEGATDMEIANANFAYLTDNWPIIALSALVVSFGSLTVLALLLHPTRPTVAAALRLASRVLPYYLLVWLLQIIIVFGGLMLFILPGIYLTARLLCIAAVAVVEERRAAFAIVARSFHLTRGSGLRIILLLLVMVMVYFVVLTALSALVGIVSILMLPPDLGRLAIILVGALIQSGFALAVTVATAAVYRQTSAQRPLII